ncbi:glutathione S-transferase [Aspergillus oleicola]
MPTYHLYSYFRSTCTNRVVIAMHLKGIPVEHTYIDLAKVEHERPDDIQQITNGRVAQLVRAIRGEAQDQIGFVREVFLAGLTAYEKLLVKNGGTFSVGDTATMADVCLAPAVEMALAYGTDLDGLPRVLDLFKRLEELPAFKKGHWRRQGDTPEAMRDTK